jgi:hypothetical protein
VRINFGPLTGVNGVVISTSPARTVVRITVKGRSVLVELDPDMILVPDRDGMGHSSDHRTQS